ncbi:MAG: FAD-dependent monooxygenase, partial [Geminicoccaceae bacterium]
MMSWDRLYRLLHDAFPTERYHEGVAVEGFAQDQAGVTVRLADGRSERADWLIAADGMRSTVRRQLLPDLEPAYAGYVAWRGLVEESAMSDSARAALCDHLAFCLPPGEQMVGYAVPGADEATAPGRRRYNWVWYRPADPRTRLPALLTGRDGRRYDLSIPPNRLKPEAVAGLRAAAERLLPPCFVEVVRLARSPFIQAICDLESQKLVLGRVVVLGDAAFVARPHAGLGATKAALDALGLAQALSARDPAAALAAWEEDRLRYGQALVARCRWLAGYLEPANFVPDEPPAVIKERIATVIAETAVSGGV